MAYLKIMLFSSVLVLLAVAGAPHDEKDSSLHPFPSGSTAGCKSYQPGHSGLTWEENEKLTQAFGTALKGGGDDIAAALKAVNERVDREVTPALWEALSFPETRIYYGTYDPPGSRRRTEDGLAGLRMIFERHLPDGSLITAILTWRCDARTGKLVFIDGPDSLRVRAELPEASPTSSTKARSDQRFASLSYSTKLDADGTLTEAHPGDYFHEDTGRVDGRISPNALPHQCAGCHASGRIKNFSRLAEDHGEPLDLKALEGYKVFRQEIDHSLQASVKRGKLSAEAAKESLAAIEAQLQDPRQHLIPKGLLAVIKRRCEEMH